MKKKPAEHDDKNLSDSDCSLPVAQCETCELTFNNGKEYESHMQGKRHQKKLAEVALMAKDLSDKNDGEIEEDESDDSSDFYCDLCDKPFTGYISYAAHIKGSKHAKNKMKQKLKKKFKDMPEVLEKEQQSNSDDDDIVKKPYAKCSICEKEFSGPEAFKNHVESVKHLKKAKLAKISQNMEVDKENISDDDEFHHKCDVCQKKFTGLVNFKTHMESAVHRKQMKKKQVAEEVKEFCVNGDSDTGYVCKECKKVFKDPLAFKCHLKNNSHEKQKAKQALVEFLKAYPEIVFVAPFDRQDSDAENSGDETDSQYYLICKLCSVSFPGPESAQDHVKSKKHINLKKEKKILKLLKEEKANSSANSGSKNSEEVNGAAASSANGKAKDSEADDFEMIN